jgi:hypothetical protein
MHAGAVKFRLTVYSRFFLRDTRQQLSHAVENMQLAVLDQDLASVPLR